MSAEIRYSDQDEAVARADVVEVCRLMHARGYLVAGDGNVSVRLGAQRLLVTPTRSRKAFLKEADLVLCDLSGAPLPGQHKRPSSEIEMHTLAYRLRPEIGAVVHAHPPFAVAHTIAHAALDKPLMPEVLVELGQIVTVPYATPTTSDLPEVLAGPLRDEHVAFLLERHGSLTIGETLAKAYDRLEILEHTARIHLYARVLGSHGRVVTGLTRQQIDALRALG